MQLKSPFLFFVLPMFFSLILVSPVFALSISPSVITFDPAIPGQKNITTVSVGRLNSDTAIQIEGTITGAAKDFVRITHPENLTVAAGAGSVNIPLEAIVTGQKEGAVITGRITFKEKGMVADGGVSANFSAAGGDIIIKVTNNDATLTTINSEMTSWNSRTHSLDLLFTAVNERKTAGRIEKIRYTLSPVDQETEPETIDVPLESKMLAPGQTETIKTSLPIDDQHVGEYKVDIAYIDEKGRTANISADTGMIFNYEIIRKKILVQRFTIVALGALLIAAIFAIDYFYLKRKFRKGR